jgi:putative endonuclease
MRSFFFWIKLGEMYKIYILYSESLNRYYIGSTDDLEGRLRRHLSNHKGYTGKFKDWVVVYTEDYKTREDALRSEKQLKGWKSSVRIKALLSREVQSSVGSEHPDS